MKGSQLPRGALGAIVHGVLLVAMLLFAYQTWTRDTTPKQTTGTVVLWNEKLGDLEAIVYTTPERSTRLEKRPGYFWALDSKHTKKAKPRPEPAEPLDPDAPPPEPDFETVTTTREYPVGEDLEKKLPAFASMRAVRDLGKLTEDQQADYKIIDRENPDRPRPTLAVVFAGRTRTFILGDKVLGGADRYALDVDRGHGYVLAGTLLTELEGGEHSIRPKRVIPLGDDVAQIRIDAGERSKTVSRITVPDDGGKQIKTWGDPGTKQADQTTANFLTKIETTLTPQQYEPTLDPATLTPLLTVTYQGGKGATLGTLTLYKREKTEEPPPAPEGAEPPPPPAPVTEYFVVTERTRVPALVNRAAGDQVEQNIATIFE